MPVTKLYEFFFGERSVTKEYNSSKTVTLNNTFTKSYSNKNRSVTFEQYLLLNIFETILFTKSYNSKTMLLLNYTCSCY